ncbi:DUF6187 family protein [Streptomyces sp. NPDC057638]|uniref:DUF6187 family protein n=1 Tax=Streptomyces sp. NPDC057638 TaxID=3346190 RepID=UPI0036D0A256
MSDDPYDTRFALIPVDGPPLTETGVMLMGLDAERLLAGLGLAALGDDPARVALAVDRIRHGAPAAPSFDSLVESGARHWRSVRPALTAAAGSTPVPVPPRAAWQQTVRLLSAGHLGEPGPATIAHLAACWLRREEIDQRAERTAPEAARG